MIVAPIGSVDQARLPQRQSEQTPRRPGISKSDPGEERGGTSVGLLAAFLLGLGARLQVHVIGFLPLSEIAVLIATPFMLPRYTARNAMRSTRWLLPLGMLWLGFTLATDLYRESDWALAARGVARVSVILAYIPFSFTFFSRDTYRRLAAFTLGVLPSIVLSAFVLRGGVHFGRELTWGSSEVNFETHWVGLAIYIAQLANLLIYHRNRLLSYAGSLAAGAFIFYGGSRAAGAAFATGTPLAWFRNLLAERPNREGVGGRVSGYAIVLFAALAAAAVWGVLEGYSYAASKGLLGERAQKKYEFQSSTSGGLFVTGRLELIGGLLAVAQSPFIGHGSWKLDTDRFFAQAVKLMEIDVNPNAYYARGYPVIPSHSHVVGAWAENGLGGGLFWGYVLLLITRVFYLPLADERRLRLWVSCAATALLWHIVFSPIGGRLETTVSLAVFLTQTDAAAAAVRKTAEIGRRRGMAMEWQPTPPPVTPSAG
jgi:hypothetical protein